jgi:hypothetical protein
VVHVSWQQIQSEKSLIVNQPRRGKAAANCKNCKKPRRAAGASRQPRRELAICHPRRQRQQYISSGYTSTLSKAGGSMPLRSRARRRYTAPPSRAPPDHSRATVDFGRLLGTENDAPARFCQTDQRRRTHMAAIRQPGRVCPVCASCMCGHGEQSCFQLGRPPASGSRPAYGPSTTCW